MNSNIPEQFICPITLEIMKNPVICEDGNTYEKEAISALKNPISPLTNQHINLKNLIPNRVIKELIEEFLQNQNKQPKSQNKQHTQSNNFDEDEDEELYTRGILNREYANNNFDDEELYRMIRKFKDNAKLTDENVLRIGVNEEGSKFRKYTKEEQKRKVQQKIRDTNFVNDMLSLSGFSQIENALNRYIQSKGSSMVLENILYDYDRIPKMTMSNMIINIKKRIDVLVSIISHNNNKYEEEMKKIVKQINTIAYTEINSLTVPMEIKTFYDSNIVNPIILDTNIKKRIEKFMDLTKYPSYFIDRILELIIVEYSEHSVALSKLSYIELFENIGNLKAEVIDLVLDALITNPRGINTFIFDNARNNLSNQQIIKLIDKVKFSSKFIDFLRFYMANMYSNITKPEELVIKLLIFNRFEEIPMRQFINDLKIEKKIFDTNKQLGIYIHGLGTNYSRENIFEMYYIMKCREFGDNENFLSHTKPITIDFSSII